MELDVHNFKPSSYVTKEAPVPIRVEIPNLGLMLVNVNNVVCAFSTKCHLNLRKIALEALHVEYRKEAGLVYMKMRSPHTTATIWSSGKIVVTGATSEEKSKIAARKYARTLQRLGFNVRFSHFRVVNVLATCQMPFPLRISHFADANKPQASYEPELHPGVTYQMQQPKATLKVFSTGSLTVTAPSVENIKLALQTLCPQLIKYQTYGIEKVDIPLDKKPANVVTTNTPTYLLSTTNKSQLLISSEYSQQCNNEGESHNIITNISLAKVTNTSSENTVLKSAFSPNSPNQIIHPAHKHVSYDDPYHHLSAQNAPVNAIKFNNALNYPNPEESEIDSSLAFLLQDENVDGLSQYADGLGISPASFDYFHSF